MPQDRFLEGNNMVMAYRAQKGANRRTERLPVVRHSSTFQRLTTILNSRYIDYS